MDRFNRNSDLIPQNLLDIITVIGAGGIGSNVIPLLSIMGFSEALIYDGDVLEEHNLSTTVFPEKHLDQVKSEIGKEVFEQYNGMAAEAKGMFTSSNDLTPKVIMGPDNMEARLAVYDTWKAMDNREILVDMRMGALAMEIVTVTAEHDMFMETWQPSGEISDEACTAKHTIFTGATVASLGINQIFSYLTNRPFYQHIWIGLNPLSITKKHLAYTE